MGLGKRAVGALAAGTLLALAGAAGAQAAGTPYAPYDGHIPFNCELQQLGTGTDFPHPDADPFCVEFDKTKQNVTDLGLLDFAAQEPARVAAAAPKCFYYQRDHWTGSIVQGTEPETYHFDGSYFFDKATGSGGVRVDNFRIGGQPADASPFVPAAYAPYFGNGGGGALFQGEQGPDPTCAARVDSALERRFVYRHTIAGGPVTGRAVGPLRLRTLRRTALRKLGPAHRRASHTDRWDVTGGGDLRAAWRGTALDRRVAALLTTSRANSRRSVSPGDSGRDARATLEARALLRVAGFRVYRAAGGGGNAVLLGVRRGTLGWIAVADRRMAGRRALRGVLGSLLAAA